MKIMTVFFIVLGLSACGTIGGALNGAGQDLSKAGEWVRNR